MTTPAIPDDLCFYRGKRYGAVIRMGGPRRSPHVEVRRIDALNMSGMEAEQEWSLVTFSPAATLWERIWYWRAPSLREACKRAVTMLEEVDDLVDEYRTHA